MGAGEVAIVTTIRTINKRMTDRVKMSEGLRRGGPLLNREADHHLATGTLHHLPTAAKVVTRVHLATAVILQKRYLFLQLRRADRLLKLSARSRLVFHRHQPPL